MNFYKLHYYSPNDRIGIDKNEENFMDLVFRLKLVDFFMRSEYGLILQFVQFFHIEKSSIRV